MPMLESPRIYYEGRILFWLAQYGKANGKKLAKQMSLETVTSSTTFSLLKSLVKVGKIEIVKKGSEPHLNVYALSSKKPVKDEARKSNTPFKQSVAKPKGGGFFARLFRGR